VFSKDSSLHKDLRPTTRSAFGIREREVFAFVRMEKFERMMAEFAKERRVNNMAKILVRKEEGGQYCWAEVAKEWKYYDEGRILITNQGIPLFVSVGNIIVKIDRQEPFVVERRFIG